jgi:hypothetical protein
MVFDALAQLSGNYALQPAVAIDSGLGAPLEDEAR